MVRGDFVQRRRVEIRALRRAITLIALGVAAAVVVSGFVMWSLDEKNFDNPWIGMWWAVQTITSVGYGDIVPRTVVGRLFASLIMVLGIASVSLLTATVASGFIARREEEEEERITEGEIDLAAAIGRLEERLDRIEQAVRR